MKFSLHKNFVSKNHLLVRKVVVSNHKIIELMNDKLKKKKILSIVELSNHMGFKVDYKIICLIIYIIAVLSNANVFI